ncbi:MAG: class I SAM-dependent methyltransferase [Bdellovibrionales bacterium]|nr:class I SAM-dependent methyltransferase [Bdellovibrionales bacterium]
MTFNGKDALERWESEGGSYKIKKEDLSPYIHGFSHKEQLRLKRQAEFSEALVYQDIDFSQAQRILEIGSGVGAQSEILLRRFPKIHLTCIDRSYPQIQAAHKYLAHFRDLFNRYEIHNMDATQLRFSDNSFDAIFICWTLEHIAHPFDVLKEAHRVLKPDGKIFVTEVMNFSFFLDPYSPHLWKYWMAFNDYQNDVTGNPFIGATLGNLFIDAGFSDIITNVKYWHLDRRQANRRNEILDYWKELLFSAEQILLRGGYVDLKTIELAKNEINEVKNKQDAVFFYAFMQASGTK